MMMLRNFSSAFIHKGLDIHKRLRRLALLATLSTAVISTGLCAEPDTAAIRPDAKVNASLEGSNIEPQRLAVAVPQEEERQDGPVSDNYNLAFKNEEDKDLCSKPREQAPERSYYTPLSFSDFQDKILAVINARPLEQKTDTDIAVFLEGRGKYCVDRAYALNLLGKSLYEKRLWVSAKQERGNHRVVHKDGIHFKIDTMEDLDPSMESAIYHFYQTLFGRGVAPSCLLTFLNIPVKAAPERQEDEPQLLKDYRNQFAQCGYNGQELEEWVSFNPEVRDYLKDRAINFVVQASQTVQGTLLLSFMEKVEKGEQHWQRIDRETIQEFFIGSLLTVAEDVKPDNIMLGEVSANNFVMVGIDNDRSFGANIVKTSYGGKSCHIVQAKNCLLANRYVLEQPLEASVAAKLLKPPEYLIQAWLKGLKEREDAYNNMIASKGFFETEDGGSIHAKLAIPLRFVPGTVTELYGRLRHLQRYLKGNKQPTLQNIFFHLDPLLAEYYGEICQLNISPLERIGLLYDRKSDFKELNSVLIPHRILRDGRTVQEFLSQSQKSFNDFLLERKQPLASASRLFVQTYENEAQKALGRLSVMERSMRAEPANVFIHSLSDDILSAIFRCLENDDKAIARLKQVNKRFYSLVTRRYEILQDNALRKMAALQPERALRYLEGLALSRKLKKDKAKIIYEGIESNLSGVNFEGFSPEAPPPCVLLLKKAAQWGHPPAQRRVEEFITQCTEQAVQLCNTEPLANARIKQAESLYRHALYLGRLTSLCDFVEWLSPQLPLFFKNPLYEGYSPSILEDMLSLSEQKAMERGCDGLLELCEAYRSSRAGMKKRLEAAEQKLEAIARGEKDVAAFQKIIEYCRRHDKAAQAKTLWQEMDERVYTVKDAWRIGNWVQWRFNNLALSQKYYDKAEKIAEKMALRHSPQGYRELLLSYFQDGEDKSARDPQGTGVYQNFTIFGEGKTSAWLARIHESIEEAPVDQKRVFAYWHLEDKTLRNPDKAHKMLERIAIEGNLQDRQYLAYLYSKPYDSMESSKYIPFDLSKAYGWYKHQNAPGAPHFESWETLKTAWRTAQKPEDKDMFYLLGCEEEKQGANFFLMTSYYEKAAALHHPDAMLRLGISALKFNIASFNKDIAAAWYEKSASLGQLEAAYFLGRLYQEKGDFFNAKRWYERAASHGYRYAQYELGMLLKEHLLEGIGSLTEAKKWLLKAAEQGKKSAQKELESF